MKKIQSNAVHCRRLEDGSGYGVFPGKRKLPPIPLGAGGRDKWELCLAVGRTVKEAWADYRKEKDRP